MEGQHRDLYIPRLPDHTQEADLRSLFQPFGPIHGLSILTNKRNPSEPIRYGFIRLASVDQSEAALAHLNGYMFHGVRLRLKWSQTQAPGRGWRCPDPHCGTFNPLSGMRCTGCQSERKFDTDYAPGALKPPPDSMAENPGLNPELPGPPRGRGQRAQARQALIWGDSPRPGVVENPGLDGSRTMSDHHQVRRGLAEECRTLRELNLDANLGAIFVLRCELSDLAESSNAETATNELEPYGEFLKKALDVVRESYFKKFAVLDTSKKFYQTCLSLPNSDDVAAMQNDLKKGAIDTLAKVIGDYLHAFPSFDILEIFPQLEAHIDELKTRCQVSRVHPRPMDMTRHPVEMPAWLGSNPDSPQSDGAARSKRSLSEFTHALEQVMTSLKDGSPPLDDPQLCVKAKELREALIAEKAVLAKPAGNRVEDNLRTMLEHFVWLRERVLTLWEQYSSTFLLAQELENNHNQVVIHKSKHPPPNSLELKEETDELGTLHEEVSPFEQESKTTTEVNRPESDDNLSDIEDEDDDNDKKP
ncbi:hypothetical protein TCAL_10988 [Tigriopus californicus]|uniref:RRM domain-containing protein n=1 Tax=Tigriopus californicus TaxID=6832 RepID=A0A553NAZ8_TIGCA|nr:uncharacterized protein LOC131889287 [Tigriopus californicus]TRY62598.1 hypothetical protein TCAL_10988 [Tigriopus californicus]|eukprot:TCALIF_10988-PA protein Name:"Similar to SAFB2 Scaffold attachment factor B2 (Homo sapiens)" AED:0.39 eAED:0.48 QI:0/-1/0/1/-1/1/1/0/530